MLQSEALHSQSDQCSVLCTMHAALRLLHQYEGKCWDRLRLLPRVYAILSEFEGCGLAKKPTPVFESRYPAPPRILVKVVSLLQGMGVEWRFEVHSYRTSRGLKKIS